MSIYNPLLRLGRTIKEGAKVGSKSSTLKTFAKPVAIGAGVGAGSYLAFKGVGEGVKSMGSETAKEATRSVTGILMIIALVLIGVYVLKKVVNK